MGSLLCWVEISIDIVEKSWMRTIERMLRPMLHAKYKMIDNDFANPIIWWTCRPERKII